MRIVGKQLLKHTLEKFSWNRTPYDLKWHVHVTWKMASTQIMANYGWGRGLKISRQCHQVDYKILNAVGLNKKIVVCKLMFLITWRILTILIGRWVTHSSRSVGEIWSIRLLVHWRTSGQSEAETESDPSTMKMTSTGSSHRSTADDESSVTIALSSLSPPQTPQLRRHSMTSLNWKKMNECTRLNLIPDQATA